MFATTSSGRFGLNFDEDSDDELMLVDDEKAVEKIQDNDEDEVMQESEEDYKKFLKESDTSLTSNYSNLPKSFKQSIMHDYIGHTIQNIGVLFYNNLVPGVSTSFSKTSSASFSELILAISHRNTVRFYTLLNDNKQMKIIEFSSEDNSITLEDNIKFIKVVDDILIICDERGTIHVYRHSVSQIPQPDQTKLVPTHELKITSSYRPFEICPNDSNNFLSFDSEALFEGDILKITVALGSSNGAIYYSTFSNTSRKPSQFDALRQVKYQHKSMLPILGLTFPIRKMVAVDIPIMLYYRTMNCVFSIDVNDNAITQAKYEPTLVMKTKDRITSLFVHPLQPNNIIVGLAKGTLIGRDQIGVWDRSVSNNAIKAITFGNQSNSIIVGDEQGFIYSIDITNVKSSQPTESEKHCIENLDGNDILHIEYLSAEEKILAINSNGRINLILN